jgi:hypothetical protein
MMTRPKLIASAADRFLCSCGFRYQAEDSHARISARSARVRSEDIILRSRGGALAHHDGANRSNVRNDAVAQALDG